MIKMHNIYPWNNSKKFKSSFKLPGLVMTSLQMYQVSTHAEFGITHCAFISHTLMHTSIHTLLLSQAHSQFLMKKNPKKILLCIRGSTIQSHNKISLFYSFYVSHYLYISFYNMIYVIHSLTNSEEGVWDVSLFLFCLSVCLFLSHCISVSFFPSRSLLVEISNLKSNLFFKNPFSLKMGNVYTVGPNQAMIISGKPSYCYINKNCF